MDRIELSAESLQLDETADTVYKLKRNPEGRKIFYVDVGNYGKEEAAKYLDDLVVNYKRKEEVEAGYFYCPYIPNLGLKSFYYDRAKSVEITDTAKAITTAMSEALTKQIDDEMQQTLVDEAKSLWSHNMEVMLWDSISTASKLEALGIDKSFLSGDIGSECISFEDEMDEILQDTDDDAMLLAFAEIVEDHWSDAEYDLALKMFRAGWESRPSIEECAANDWLTSCNYIDPKPFLTKEELREAL